MSVEPVTDLERLQAAFSKLPIRTHVGDVSAGRLGLCDPLTADGPLDAGVSAPGLVPVYVGLVEAGGDHEIAWAELAPDAATRWERLGVYGVDTGTACFADVAAGSPQVEIEDVQGRGRHGTVDNRVVWFVSGAGDGVYPVWLGRDDEGRAVVVATDFGLGGLARLALDGPEVDAPERVIGELAMARNPPGPSWFRRFAPDGLEPLWATCADGHAMVRLLERAGQDPDGRAARILAAHVIEQWAQLGETEIAEQMRALLPDLPHERGRFSSLVLEAMCRARPRFPGPTRDEQMWASIRGQPFDEPVNPLKRAELRTHARAAAALREAGFEAPALSRLR